MMTFGNNKKELNNFLSEYKNDKDFNEFILKLQDVNTNNLPNSNFVGKNIIESEEYIIDEQNYYSMDRYVIKKGFGLKTHDHINMFVVSKVLKGSVKITSYMKKDYEAQR